jgi:hypothetical protein
VAKIALEEIIKIIELGRQGLSPVDYKPIILPPNLVVRQSSIRLMEGGEAKGS